MHIPLSSLAAPLARRFLGLPLAFATLFAGPALRAETQVAAALRAKVTPDVISKWSPDVRFHERERYFPSSAEELFKGATLFKVNPDNERSTGESKPIQSPSDLSKAGVEWRIRYDPKNPAVKQGSMTNGNVTAPMYVSVMVPNDASFVDIRYCFLFGFNGAQSMRSLSPIGHVNYTMGSLAEHDGDWEGFTVRLGPDLQEFIYGLTEAHGDGHKYTRPQMDFFEGTHPQIQEPQRLDRPHRSEAQPVHRYHHPGRPSLAALESGAELPAFPAHRPGFQRTATGRALGQFRRPHGKRQDQ
jgi:hypothetical protein